MAGRGRGKTTFTQEQLQTLGCVGKDMPMAQLAPPPTYPPLMTKPVNIPLTPDEEIMLEIKMRLRKNAPDSPYYTGLKPDAQAKTLSGKPKREASYPWHMMPRELWPAHMKKRRKPLDETAQSSIGAKVKKTAQNIDARFQALEQKERKNNETAEAPTKANSDSEDEEEVAEEMVDDEMDDENDYGNSYFDNGESYNEEDDNLDDGPVY